MALGESGGIGELPREVVAHTRGELVGDLAGRLLDAVFDPGRNGVPDAVVVHDQAGHEYVHPVTPDEVQDLDRSAWRENDGGMTAEQLAQRLVHELRQNGFDLAAPDLNLSVSLRRGP